MVKGVYGCVVLGLWALGVHGTLWAFGGVVLFLRWLLRVRGLKIKGSGFREYSWGWSDTNKDVSLRLYQPASSICLCLEHT